MFYQNRFTERARQALTLAQEAAASFGHSYIGSEHLLLGLLREGGGPAAKALTAAGVTDEALVRAAGHDAAHQAHCRAVRTVRE